MLKLKPQRVRDPVLEALEAAPLDDEPESAEERAAVVKAKTDPTALTTEELCTELGIALDASRG